MATTVTTDITGTVLTSAAHDIIVTTDEERLQFTLKKGSTSILDVLLYADADSEIRVREIRQLLEQALHDDLYASFSYTFKNVSGTTVASGSFKARYCRVEFVQSYSEVIAQRFLTELNKAKVTTLGRKEYLHLVVTGSTAVKVSRQLWRYGSMTTSSRTIVTLSASTSVQTVDVSPELFKEYGYELSQYTITAGSRKMVFVVDPRLSEADPCMVFRNSWGCQETIYCTGTLTLQPEYNRSAAIIDGEYRNYYIDENRVHQANTGVLTPDMADWADELMRSEEVYLLDLTGHQYKEVQITDCDNERDNSDDSLPRYTFKYRLSQDNHRLNLYGVDNTLTEGRIFDSTYDTTFN